MHHPTRLLTLGFTVVILLMIALAYIGVQSSGSGGSSVNRRVNHQLQKINLSIAEEDIRIIQELNPVRTPESSTREILITGEKLTYRNR